MKHRFAYFGIGKPELARLCRPFLKDAAKQPVDWDFVRRCWDDPHRELQYAALEYLKKMQQHLTPQDIPRLQTLITEKSWWDSSDVLDRIVGDIALHVTPKPAPSYWHGVRTTTSGCAASPSTTNCSANSTPHRCSFSSPSCCSPPPCSEAKRCNCWRSAKPSRAASALPCAVAAACCSSSSR
jgi:DNA alkylation repair enzyme